MRLSATSTAAALIEGTVVTTLSLAAPGQPHATPRRRTTAHPAHKPSLRIVPPLREIEPVQLAFDFDWEIEPGLPAVPPAPRHLHLVPGGVAPASQPPAPSLDEILGMPDAGRWVARLARAVSEVATGLRPPGQLTRYVARDELARITARGQAVARHPSSRSRAGVARITAVRSVRLCPVSDSVVETSAVLLGGERAQAIGMRLERVGTTWQVTDIALP